MEQIDENAINELMNSSGVDINSSITSRKEAKGAKLNPAAQGIERKGFKSIDEIVEDTSSIYKRAQREFEAFEMGTNEKSKAQETKIEKDNNTQNRDSEERI